MPRLSRKYNEYTKTYHVILRGIDKQDIFLDDQDRHKFLSCLVETKEKFNYEIYSYCLMDNHVHLLIYDINMCLSKIMQSIAIKYSKYFNKKYSRVGHLFQNRFLSKNVESQIYFMQLCRYIHRNPEKARIAKTRNYRWSSYREYVGKVELANTNLLLKIFSNDKKIAIEEFVKFHNLDVDGINDICEYEMTTKLNDEEAKECMKYILKEEEIYEMKNYSKKDRDDILKLMSQIKGISLAQIARITGINKKVVERAVKKEKYIIK